MSTTPTASGATGRKPGFLDLPGELRNAIYELCAPKHYINIASPSALQPAIHFRLSNVHPLIASELKGYQDQIHFMLNTTNIHKDKEPQWASTIWNAWMDSMKEAEIQTLSHLVFYTNHFLLKVHFAHATHANLQGERFKFDILQPRDAALETSMRNLLTQLAEVRGEKGVKMSRSEVGEVADAVLQFDNVGEGRFCSVRERFSVKEGEVELASASSSSSSSLRQEPEGD